MAQYLKTIIEGKENKQKGEFCHSDETESFGWHWAGFGLVYGCFLVVGICFIVSPFNFSCVPISYVVSYVYKKRPMDYAKSI